MDIWYTSMGLHKTMKQKIFQRFQPEVLRLITNAPGRVSNVTLLNDLQISFVTEEIHRLSTLYHQRVLGHNKRTSGKKQQPTECKEIGKTVAVWPTSTRRQRRLKSSIHHSPATGPVRVSSVDDFSTQDSYLEQIYLLLQRIQEYIVNIQYIYIYI
jgi:hypothetical protein